MEKLFFYSQPAVGLKKGASCRQRLVPRHCSKCLQHPYPAPPGKNGRLKAASAAEELKPSAMQGWTVLVPIPSSPLCASADCCLIYQNGNMILSPPLSTLKSAMERKKRIRCILRKWCMWLQLGFPTWIKYPHPPRFSQAFLFYRWYQNQFATFLWSPSPWSP